MGRGVYIRNNLANLTLISELLRLRNVFLFVTIHLIPVLTHNVNI